MLDDIASAIDAGLSYLAEQVDDSPSAFFPMPLLLSILRPFKNNNDSRITHLVVRGIKIIKQEQQDNGAFNYWRHQAPERIIHPYPDDLDDTALAYAALHAYSREGLSGNDAAHFTKLLVSAETTPGGPYNTWLLDFKKASHWSDVDPIVNANIALTLQLMNVRMPGLQRYLKECLVAGKLSSRYYFSPLVVLYFISRAYRGAARSTGRAIILAARQDANWGTPLATACALSALLRWEENPQTLIPAILSLLKIQTAGHWPAENLYIEGVTEQKIRFFKSSVLTTAFCLEALELARQRFLPTQVHVALRTPKPKIPHGPFKQEAAKESERIQRHPFWNGSLNWARQAQIALGEAADSISSSTLADLASAQLAGLSGYGIIDDVVDKQRPVTELPYALSAIRHCHSIYARLLPDETLVRKIFSDMETALDREAKGLLPKDQSRKSLGAALPVLVIAILSGWTSDRLTNLRSYFEGLLTALQWNDDAHDYQADWLAGRTTPVTKRLRQLAPTSCDQEQLQTIFWQKVFPEILKKIKSSLALASTCLKAVALPLPAYFNGLLEEQFNILKKAEAAHINTIVFLKEYRAMEE